MRGLRQAAASIFLLASLSPAAAKDFALEEFFAGQTRATGTFRAINGVKRDFTVSLAGHWNGRTLTLREDFVFSDGERDRKTWRFTKVAPNRYVGRREDVIGETTVRVEGNVARFAYDVYLDPKNKANRVRFFDTLVLSKDGRTVANRATVFKSILPVARVRVDFER